MSLEYKLIAAAIMLLILGGAAYFGLHQVYAAGEAHTQLAWDKDVQTRQAAYDKQVADISAQLAMTRKTNEAIHGEYDEKLAQASASAAQFAERLRDATNSLNSSTDTLSKVGDLLGSATASQQASAQRLGQLVSLITDFHTECAKNDAQLDAIVAQAKPQT